MSRSFVSVVLALVLAGCVDEDPTNVGDALLPSGGVLTFEVILPASSFLEADTSFSGYQKPQDASFSAVARKFENALNANTLLRFSLPPKTIAVRTTGATIVTDSAPRFTGGRLVLKFDSLTATARPIALRAFNTAQEWNETATWTNRVDSATVKLPWTTAGGTRGAEIGTATWSAGDSAVFAVDSQTVALWADSANRSRGTIIVSDTDGARAHILAATVYVNARSRLNADTTVVVPLVPAVRTFVFNPTLPTTFGGLRAGGVPAWRALLRFRSDLATLVIPCAGGPAGCQVRLDSTHINIAQLRLRPALSPPGFVPEDSVVMDVRLTALSPNVPLGRSPVGSRVAVSSPLAPTLFRSPAANDVVTFDITSFIINQTDPSIDDDARATPVLTILQVPEAGTFGFASFDAAPSLRLVITTPIERRQ